METYLIGRLRNTHLPKSHALMPLFDAVVNSIHAIDEAGISSEEGRISVEIIRSKQSQFKYNETEQKQVADIEGFKITDNGIGFDEVNFKSFKTFDSDHKAEIGGRGVGRLLWLKAFGSVPINSVFIENDGSRKYREFIFNKNGISRHTTNASTKERKTTVFLSGFIKQYSEASKKTIDSIANSLFEHCLWYFVKEGGTPEITIIDDEATINLDDIYEQHMFDSAFREEIQVKDYNFQLIHIKLKNSTSQNSIIAYCAANRLVKEENINNKIPGLFGRMQDEESEFIYACYVNSIFLDERVRSERTDFNIIDNVEGLFSETEISFKEIRHSILNCVNIYLSPYLENNKKASIERINSFVSKSAPRYRPIIDRIPEDDLYVDPHISDKELDIILHKQLSEIENQLLKEGHAIMNPKDEEGEDEYYKRLHEYLLKAEDIKKSDLANYVSHRRVVIDLLGKAIERQKDGKYIREDIIHKLIMPMGKTSNQVTYDNCNLWLIDESLAFHNYLASDKTLSSMPITTSNETKEPDILALNICDNPILVSEGSNLPLASIVVIEIKRPMRNDAAHGEDKDPIEQALGYLGRIREGKVQTVSGRPIPNSDAIPGFCYILCDITSKIKERCKLFNLKITSDSMGYFGYNDNYDAYIEVISFDRLVNAAKERNRAFFDKLGLPTS